MNIIVESEGGSTESYELYSQEGFEVLSDLWSKSAFQQRIMYEPTWLGVPIIQYPNDIVALQELVWKIRPDFVVETGVAHGGTSMLFASILELIGHGRVIGVDNEIRSHNREAMENHCLSKRIELIEGSSIDPDTFQEVRKRLKGNSNIIVSLDSNHSYKHVLAEMNLYGRLVGPGSRWPAAHPRPATTPGEPHPSGPHKLPAPPLWRTGFSSVARGAFPAG